MNDYILQQQKKIRSEIGRKKVENKSLGTNLL